MQTFNPTAAAFLKNFFWAGGKRPGGEKAFEFFRNVFVEPPSFGNFTKELQPDERTPPIVFVQGHPRCGKTFTTIAAIAHILDSGDEVYDNQSWWDAGQDCLRLGSVCQDDTTVVGIAKAVEKRLSELMTRSPGGSKLRFVLLDDLLGTNKPRRYGEEAERLRPYFLAEREQNPWLRLLPKECKLIITGRSLYFFLLETFLGWPIGSLSNCLDAASYCILRTGIFRTATQRNLVGNFDSKTLEEAAEKNRKHSRYSANNATPGREDDREKEQKEEMLVRSAPLVAFSRDSSVPVKPNLKRVAAEALFRDDLDALANCIANLGSGNSGDVAPKSSWSNSSLHDLDKAYVMLIAPGLLFLGPGAYEAIGIDSASAHRIASALYYSDECLQSDRVPNEYYMIAVDDHLKKNYRQAIDAFDRVFNRSSPSDANASDMIRATGLMLRGFIERGRHRDRHPKLQDLRAYPAFDAMYRRHRDAGGDFLLQLEYDRECRADSDAPVTPGLAAAVGWAIHGLFEKEDRAHVRECVRAWFKRHLFSVESRSSDSETANGADWETLAAFYSTFLQWTLKTPHNAAENDDLATLVTNLPDNSSLQNSTHKRIVKMIREDELLWGMLEEALDLKHLAQATTLLQSLQNESKVALQHADQERAANRFFTLAWHNGWMDDAYPAGSPSEGVHLDKDQWRQNVKQVKAWFEAHQATLMALIRNQPALIENNLQYHWSHFLTQHAVWMRDWCLAVDPGEYEQKSRQSQIAEGSKKPENNRWFLDMALAVFQQGDSPRAIRNLMLLAGTRWDRLPQSEQIIARLSSLLKDRTASEHARKIECYLLQAIFELSRQGFLACDAKVAAQSSLHKWCLERLIAAVSGGVIDDAWAAYVKELEQITYALDLRPRAKEGWKDVLEPLRNCLE